MVSLTITRSGYFVFVFFCFFLKERGAYIRTTWQKKHVYIHSIFQIIYMISVFFEPYFCSWKLHIFLLKKNTSRFILSAKLRIQGSMVLLRFKNPLLDLAPSTLVYPGDPGWEGTPWGADWDALYINLLHQHFPVSVVFLNPKGWCFFLIIHSTPRKEDPGIYHDISYVNVGR